MIETTKDNAWVSLLNVILQGHDPRHIANAIETADLYKLDRFGRPIKVRADSRKEALDALFQMKREPQVSIENLKRAGVEIGTSDGMEIIELAIVHLNRVNVGYSASLRFGWPSDKCPSFAEKCIPATQQREQPSLHPKRERTLLNTIGALLEVIDGGSGKGKYSKFETREELKRHIAKHYDGIFGLSQRSLDATFSLAKNSLDNSASTPN